MTYTLLDAYSYLGKTKYNATTKKFFTVEDGEDVYVYNDLGHSKKDIRVAIAVAFIDEERYNLDGEYKVAGRYPNYYIEEVGA
jgi:hypothetical protein